MRYKGKAPWITRTLIILADAPYGFSQSLQASRYLKFGQDGFLSHHFRSINCTLLMLPFDTI